MRKVAARLLTAVAAAGLVATGALSGGAGSAEAATLPGAHKAKSVPGGTVSIRLFDESYRVQNSVANNPFSREVFVSGKVRVTTGGGLKGGTVTTGYLVGCQMNFGANSGAAIVTNELDGTQQGIDEVLDPEKTKISGGFELSPGEARFVPVIQAKVDGEAAESFTFSGATGGVAYRSERFGVNGCAGFAQARALVNVQVSSDGNASNITLYGKPFSIG